MTSAHGSRYDADLETLRDAYGAYRRDQPPAKAAPVVAFLPGHPSTADLVENLLNQVRAAAQDYAEAADNAGLSDTDRYDWQGSSPVRNC